MGNTKKLLFILIILGYVTIFKIGDAHAANAAIEYRDNQPDIINKWGLDKRFPESRNLNREVISTGVKQDFNNQLSDYKLPSIIGESTEIPIVINGDKASLYYIAKIFDKTKLQNRIFWRGIRNNNQQTMLQEMTVNLNKLTLKTEAGEIVTDYEIKFDKAYVYYSYDDNWVETKEQTIMTIKKIGNKQALNKVILSFDDLYFKGIGYFQGPWGYWDGTYANKLFEPGQWANETFGTDYPDEEFRADTPVYRYRTKPEGEINPFSIDLFTEKELSAEPNAQSFNLGADLKKYDYSIFIKNVKYGEQLVSNNEYSTKLVESFDTDTIGNKIAKVEVTLNSDKSKSFEINVPVQINWGNSVVYGGYDYFFSGRTTAAFTFNANESSPYISASQGKDDDDLPIHSYFPDGYYYTFDWFNMSEKESFLIDDIKEGNKFIKATGTDLKKEKLKQWGVNQKQSVNYGDIVRASQKESKNWLYQNEQRLSFNEGKNAVYYEITKSGYRVLHFNHLATKNGSIPIYSSKEYLDEHISDYIDLKTFSNINIKGFSEYPETKIAGKQKGKILVEESLSSTDKKVQYEYEIDLLVEPGDIIFSAPENLSFNNFKKTIDNQTVKRKNNSNLGLSIIDNRGTNSQGNWKLTVKIKNNSDNLAPFVIFRNKDGLESYISESPIQIYNQEKQNNPTEPLVVDVSNTWTSETGILLKIPAKNKLLSKKYTTIITWNIMEGP